MRRMNCHAMASNRQRNQRMVPCREERKVFHMVQKQSYTTKRHLSLLLVVAMLATFIPLGAMPSHVAAADEPDPVLILDYPTGKYTPASSSGPESWEVYFNWHWEDDKVPDGLKHYELSYDYFDNDADDFVSCDKLEINKNDKGVWLQTEIGNKTNATVLGLSNDVTYKFKIEAVFEFEDVLKKADCKEFELNPSAAQLLWIKIGKKEDIKEEEEEKEEEDDPSPLASGIISLADENIIKFEMTRDEFDAYKSEVTYAVSVGATLNQGDTVFGYGTIDINFEYNEEDTKIETDLFVRSAEGEDNPYIIQINIKDREKLAKPGELKWSEIYKASFKDDPNNENEVDYYEITLDKKVGTGKSTIVTVRIHEGDKELKDWPNIEYNFRNFVHNNPGDYTFTVTVVPKDKLQFVNSDEIMVEKTGEFKVKITGIQLSGDNESGYVGETVNASVMDADDKAVDLDIFTYRWQIRNSGTVSYSDIDGETKASYIVKEGDLNKEIRVFVDWNTDEAEVDNTNTSPNPKYSSFKKITNEGTVKIPEDFIITNENNGVVTLTWTTDQELKPTYSIFLLENSAPIEDPEIVINDKDTVSFLVATSPFTIPRSFLTPGIDYRCVLMVQKEPSYQSAMSKVIPIKPFLLADKVKIELENLEPVKPESINEIKINQGITAEVTITPTGAAPVDYIWEADPSIYVEITNEETKTATIKGIKSGECKVTCTITNADGSTVSDAVDIKVLNNEAKILVFKVDGRIGEISQNSTPPTVKLDMPKETELKNIKAEFELSLNATAKIINTSGNDVLQESGKTVNDFTNKLNYIISPEDESASVAYEVTITESDLTDELSVPEIVGIDDNGIASWKSVTGATGYIVQLYLNNVPAADAMPVTGISGVSKDLLPVMKNYPGSYTFCISAVGDPTILSSKLSAPSEPFVMKYIKSLVDLEPIHLRDEMKDTEYSKIIPTKITAILDDNTEEELAIKELEYDVLIDNIGTQDEDDADIEIDVEKLPANIAKVPLPKSTLKVLFYDHLVTFDSSGGSVVSEQYVIDKGTVTEPVVPTKEGYEFGGWYTDKVGDELYNPYNFRREVTDDLTLYAKWDLVPDHTVTFTIVNETDNALKVKQETVKHNSAVTEYKPIKEGFTLDGWYKKYEAEALTDKYNFNSLVTEDLVLYAKWEVGPTPTPGGPTVTPTPTPPGGTPGVPTPTPTPDGTPGEPTPSPTPEETPGATATPSPTPTRPGSGSGGGGGSTTTSTTPTSSPAATSAPEPTEAPGTGTDGGGTTGGRPGGGGSTGGPTTVPSGGQTVNLGNGVTAFLPAGTVIQSDGTIVIPHGGAPAVFTVGGIRYTIPGGFIAIPDDRQPLGYAFEFTSPFKDVQMSDPNAWYYGDVAFGYLNGLFVGTSIDEFSPDDPITRGQLITVLGRLDGVDASQYSGSVFADVDANEYYAPYIQWGVANGIALGVSSSMYEPERPITREEVFSMFLRYTQYLNTELPQSRMNVVFADEDQIAGYAREALAIMYRAGIAQGIGDNFINPKGNATRAEAAAIIHRLSQRINLGFLEPML